MNPATSVSSRPHESAPISEEALRGLDALLGRYLHETDAAPALAALGALMAGQPIAVGPLRALGCTMDDADLRERLAILRSTYPPLKRYKDSLGITAPLLGETFAIYIPIARFLLRRARALRRRHGRAAVFGINGAQGSGKTTFNAFMQLILSQGLGARVVGLSIDDVYKTYEERQAMGRQVHPLFAIRSVAGTHDTALAMDTLRRLMHAEAGGRVAIPRFDKMAKGGHGDRAPEAAWPRVEGPLDLVIFEGWMVGARPQPGEALARPVNRREAEDDADGRWRSTMNRLLATDYDALFALLDDLLVLQVRGMEDVLRNRELQEQHQRLRLAEARARGEDTGDAGAMTPEEVVDFVGLYERTTRHMLASLPERARLTLYIGEGHRIEALRVNGLPAVA